VAINWQGGFTCARFSASKTVLAPAIEGSVGNAVTQMALALGEEYAMSSTAIMRKPSRRRRLDFNEVIDTNLACDCASLKLLTMSPPK
jgi:NADPH2:quinone reductase